MQSPPLGQVQPHCALCLDDKPLCDSHIIPDVLFAGSYDDKHQMIAAATNDLDGAINVQQSPRYPMLCSDCETLINREYETPFKKFWLDSSALQRVFGGKHRRGAAILTGIDYARFKLFHLSIIWRAGATLHPAFGRVQLGVHEDRLRRMILHGQAGPSHVYPVACGVLFDDQRDIVDNLFLTPLLLGFGKHRAYDCVFGGCKWFYVLATLPDVDVAKFALKPSGALPLSELDYGDAVRTHVEYAKRANGQVKVDLRSLFKAIPLKARRKRAQGMAKR